MRRPADIGGGTANSRPATIFHLLVDDTALVGRLRYVLAREWMRDWWTGAPPALHAPPTHQSLRELHEQYRAFVAVLRGLISLTLLTPLIRRR
ncbi:hypothetical protein DAT35_37800 [Vitiosangium sp. GDMCC 1.1324]|nr:hypothetical protein DAT35_37800 [Vitiosangium sp. GDMCC 1.1324]